MRIIVGISGASGVVLGYKLLLALKNAGAETHLVVSEVAKEILRLETDIHLDDVFSLADHHIMGLSIKKRAAYAARFYCAQLYNSVQTRVYSVQTRVYSVQTRANYVQT